jgi:hypothetical protein
MSYVLRVRVFYRIVCIPLAQLQHISAQNKTMRDFCGQFRRVRELRKEANPPHS